MVVGHSDWHCLWVSVDVGYVSVCLLLLGRDMYSFLWPMYGNGKRTKRKEKVGEGESMCVMDGMGWVKMRERKERSTERVSECVADCN